MAVRIWYWTCRGLILLLLVLSCEIVFSQGNSGARSIPGEIHGQVRLASGGAPAQNALVRLESFRGGLVGQLMTDRTGKFRFSGLKPDLYVVTIHAAGFKDSQQQVDLQTTASAYVLLQLIQAQPAATETNSPPSSVLDAKTPAEARKEFEKGRAELNDGKNVESGIRHLEKAIGVDPEFFEAQLLLGTAYADARQWEKAERALRRALEIKPETPQALFALGEVYHVQGRNAEAEKSLLDGLKLDDRSWQGHLALGKTYWAMGDVNRAMPHAVKAHELNPDAPQVHLLLGNVLLRNREPQRALSEFQDYLKLEPEGPFAPQTRALVEKIQKALSPPGS